ncbi:MAG: phosphate:acyl-[acyl carrier protein] acyltransferase [Chloroflexi bacterium]|nr:phosphate:acyl-[acyl carrier protein] acyltransferase [Chloroflexota bacterium]
MIRVPIPRIVLDGMGGDFAPTATVAGALLAHRQLGASVILTGPESLLRDELQRQHANPSDVRVVDAPEIIGMGEHPVAAVRSRRKSSIVVGLDLVSAGEAEAFVSAGNTGAAMAAAVLRLRRIEGIDRPALATPFPTSRGACLLLDVGANADARAQNLAQFGIMGVTYAERVLGIAQPRVALLNIGEEESKGSLVAQEAHLQLARLGLNFIGNIEGKDIPEGTADVIVMDGFVGNILIKFAEGLASNLMRTIRAEIRANPVSTLLGIGLKPMFDRIRGRMDYADYGGAPLLGVNGICIVAHGRSTPRAIRNAIRVAGEAANQSLISVIKEGVAAATEKAPIGSESPSSSPTR